MLALLAGSAGAEPDEARIPLDGVTGVYVREHDGSWTTYIPGAPEMVNRAFLERYVDAPAPEPLTTERPALPASSWWEFDSGEGKLSDDRLTLILSC